MAKPTKATKYIHEAAQYVIDSQFTVTMHSALSWVNISSADPAESIFLQGQEADEYIDEVNVLCKRYPSLNLYTAMYSLAKPYIDCLD